MAQDQLVKVIAGTVAALALMASVAIVMPRRTTAVAASAVAPAPPAPDVEQAPAQGPSLDERLTATADLPKAIEIIRPTMVERQVGSDADPASSILAMWSYIHMRWVTLQELPLTRRALIMKDPAAEMGKRLCWSGSVVEIGVDRSAGFPVYDGGIVDEAGDVIRFYAVGASTDILEHSYARLCGVVTGTLSYENSGGGVTHSVRLVGMFDLPENRRGYAPASAR